MVEVSSQTNELRFGSVLFRLDTFERLSTHDLRGITSKVNSIHCDYGKKDLIPSIISHNLQSQQLEQQVKSKLAYCTTYPTTNMSDLQILSKVEIGGQELSNRVVLAPLTRAR